MRAYSSMPRHRVLDFSVRLTEDQLREPEHQDETIFRLFPKTTTPEENLPLSDVKERLDVRNQRSISMWMRYRLFFVEHFSQFSGTTVGLLPEEIFPQISLPTEK